MKDKRFKRTLVTTALPYANGPVHIGHLAGVYVPADIYTRYLRSLGEDVIMIGGSDEHGVPITIKAQKEGVTPQDIVDRYHNIIKSSMEGLGISFDVYSRTTSATHRQMASEFFRTLYDKGEFIERTTSQLYDEQADQWLADRYVIGTCPHCGFERAYGDQCEHCGTSLNATDLIDPHSAITGNVPVLRETKHWYMPLDKWEPALREWILEGHKEWRANVYGQCKSWLDEHLQPRAVTRDLNWGIPVPIEGAEGKVLYVWFDAPIGYISNTKELLPDTWEQYWKSSDTRIINFIGKDNIVFHCLIFPAMLMAHGGYQLPENVPANEFLNLEGEKISTSRNWAVWLNEYLEDFPGKADVLRYVLTANAPETKDNDFTWRDFQARNNNELVAILGNFVNRALVLVNKYCGGVLPERGELAEVDKAVLDEVAGYRERIGDLIETFHMRDALKEVMNLARAGNKYLADTEPWKVVKTDAARVDTIMNIAMQIVANLSIAIEPFMPFSAARLCEMLLIEPMKWPRLGSDNLLPVGHKVSDNPGLLFVKVEDAEIEAQEQRLQRIKQENIINSWRPAPVAPAIDFNDFLKLDIRVGTVKACERVKKADKLLQLTLDDGAGERTIVSGIARYYDPQELVGKQVCFIANLPPRVFKGIESRGMILSAEDADGRLVVIGPAGAVRPGVSVK